MRIIVIGWIVTSGLAWGVCINNITEDNVIGKQRDKTIEMLSEEERKLKDAISDYKEVLEKKNEMMMILWKTTNEIEYVMKENHILRKRIMKHWENVKYSPSDAQSF